MAFPSFLKVFPLFPVFFVFFRYFSGRVNYRSNWQGNRSDSANKWRNIIWNYTFKSLQHCWNVSWEFQYQICFGKFPHNWWEQKKYDKREYLALKITIALERHASIVNLLNKKLFSADLYDVNGERYTPWRWWASWKWPCLIQRASLPLG